MKVEQMKYLEVLLDSELNFHANADCIWRELSKKVTFISRVRKNLSKYTKKLFYNSITALHLQFCSTLLYSVPSYKINRLQIIQNRALRTILQCNVKYSRFNVFKYIVSVFYFNLRIIGCLIISVKKLKNLAMYIHIILEIVKWLYTCWQVQNWSNQKFSFESGIVWI